MNAKKWGLLIVAALIFSAVLGSVAAQEADSPGAAVTGFYDWYLDYIMGTGEFRNPLVDRAYRDSEYLTQDLIALTDERLANAAETGLNYDLFLCAQDLPGMYQYEVIRVQSGEALVLLRQHFGDNPRSHNLTLALNDNEGTWKIDTVTCGDTLTPRGVVEDFYTWYLNQWQQIRDSGTDGNPLIEGAYREYPFFTQDFIATVDTQIANRTLGSGDPFLCAQDIPGGTWAHDVSLAGSEAVVLVQTFFQGNPVPHNLTVTLELANNQWRIAQITCDATPETMAKLLYRQYADQIRYNMDNNIDMDVLRYPMPHWDRNVSPALLERLVAHDAPAADPVLCAQDIPERFTTALVDSSDTTATIQISGDYPGGPDTYNTYPLALVTMERNEGQWMLTDITCSG